MATLKQSIELAAKNPDSPFAIELRKRIESGQYNNLAKQEGINLPSISKQTQTQQIQPAEQKQTGVVPQEKLSEGAKNIQGFVQGFVKEAAQRVASVGQNIAKVVSGFTEKAIGIKPQEGIKQLAEMNIAITKKLRDIPEGDSRRQALQDAISKNNQAIDVINKEEQSRIKKEQIFTERPDFITPEGKAEEVGATVEKVAEFLVPSGFGLKALSSTKVGRALQEAKDLNVIGKATRSLLKGVGEGADFAVKTGAQLSTEDLETQAKGIGGAFVTGLLLTPAIDAAGAVIQKGVQKVTNWLPERLMSTIFKTTEDDLRAEWSSIAKGKPLNKTLAREALEADLVGSPQKMGVYSIKKLDEVEKAVQAGTKSAKPIELIKTEADKAVNFLRDIASKYEGPYSKISVQATNLADELASQIGAGGINPNLVLRLKRFFDGMRMSPSFKMDPVLSLKQESLKNASNVFRQKLYEAGFKDAMEKERIFIEALDALVDYGAKAKNKQIIGFVDLLAGGGGMVSGGPFGAITAAVGLRAAKQAPIITSAAQSLRKAGTIAEEIAPKARQITGQAAQLATQGIPKSE